MSRDDQHKTFEAIIKLYDLAENLLETTFDTTIDDPTRHLDVIEPLIEHIEEATEKLLEEYTALANEGKDFTPECQQNMEIALRKIHNAIEECRKSIEEEEDGK